VRVKGEEEDEALAYATSGSEYTFRESCQLDVVSMAQQWIV
jgi:hypothetical protein